MSVKWSHHVKFVLGSPINRLNILNSNPIRLSNRLFNLIWVSLFNSNPTCLSNDIARSTRLVKRVKNLNLNPLILCLFRIKLAGHVNYNDNKFTFQYSARLNPHESINVEYIQLPYQVLLPPPFFYPQHFFERKIINYLQHFLFLLFVSLQSHRPFLFFWKNCQE